MGETEITVEQLARMDADDVLSVDLRDPISYEYGHIPGAINLSRDALDNVNFKNKTVCLYCRNGVVSLSVAEELAAKGVAAVSLKGGYFAWLRLHISETNTEESAKKIEQSLTKKFHESLFSPFVKAINE